MAKDYYSSLGVDKNASADEIKSAYRSLAKKYHPDMNKEPGAEAKFKEINEAYECLGDEKKKANYDQFGSADGPQGFGDGSGGFGDFFGGGGGGFSDIFGDIFGGMFGGNRGAQQNSRGEDINLSMSILFEEAAFGVKKTIKFQKIEECSACRGTGAKGGSDFKTCTACGGKGRVRYVQNTIFGQSVTEGACKTCNGTGKIIKEKCENCNGKGFEKATKTLDVEVPAGIDDGQVIRIRGEGHASQRRGTSGDLTIKVSVSNHRILKRQGFDLLLELYIPFTTAMLGGKVKVPTLTGMYELKINELTASGTLMRVKGKGMKVLNRDSYGDLLVTVKAEPPKSLDRKTRELLEQIDKNLGEGSYSKYKDFLSKTKG